MSNKFASEVGPCFDYLIKHTANSYGCFIAENQPHCTCSMDSPFIHSYPETFQEARDALCRDTNTFQSIEAERWEGNMYVTYKCDQTDKGTDNAEQHA